LIPSAKNLVVAFEILIAGYFARRQLLCSYPQKKTQNKETLNVYFMSGVYVDENSHERL